MARITKETKNIKKDTKNKNDEKAVKKVTAIKKTSTAKKTATTKNTAKKAGNIKKATAKKKSTPKKVSASNKTDAAKGSTTSKKTITKKSNGTKKAVAKKTSKKEQKVEVVEYYDLPYRYNQTVVKVLAQTPSNLFVYWDISDEDRKNLENKYGKNFFETTKPVLNVYNDTLNYSFQVEINDFANSWYLHVSDSNCYYRIELGRLPIIKTEKIIENYFPIAISNDIASPNDKILFDPNQKMIYFRNVKTGLQIEKSIYTMSFLTNMGKIYNIYDLYKNLYKTENIEEIYDLSNPSS